MRRRIVEVVRERALHMGAPSPPVTPLAGFPSHGVWVLRGSSATKGAVCVTDPTATTFNGLAIAAQCCDGSTCRRNDGDNTATGCMAGVWSTSFTYTT